MLKALVTAAMMMAAQAAPMVVLPPAPAVPPAPTPPYGMRIVTWTAGEARCAVGPIVFERAPMVDPGSAWGGASEPKPQTFRFYLGEAGRPLGIMRAGSEYLPGGDDIAPALAASRFTRHEASGPCSIAFTPHVTTIADTPLATLYAYTIFPPQTPSAEIWARVRAPGTTCTDPPPEVRLRAFPPFSDLPKQPGARSWSLIGYDIDAGGKPVHLARVDGSGNAALDLASVRAAAQSRFAPGARAGCRYPYWLGAAAMPAPAIPEAIVFHGDSATCPGEVDWSRRPRLTYPQAFRRRAIEGWAVIGYDVAPWGQTGNVRVLAAEPAEAFGDEAKQIIQNAMRVAPNRGLVGCVDRVRFVMGDGTRKANEDPPAPVIVD